MQRWRARKQIKEGENPGGDFSKADAADRESDVEHMQTAASSNGRRELARTPGLGNGEKKRKTRAAGPGEKTGAWADGFRMAGWRKQD